LPPTATLNPFVSPPLIFLVAGVSPMSWASACVQASLQAVIVALGKDFVAAVYFVCGRVNCA
jgi:hypothetical protein